MRSSFLIPAFALAAALAAGCGGAHSTLRYGHDGQPERFIECSGQPMSRCYDQALADCPQGYYLVEDSQVSGGTKGGAMFGKVKHIGASAHSTEITWKNQLVIRCKPGPAADARPQ